MSRFRRYALAMISGYALLGVNTVYTLVSIPLALTYLSNPEFGLWALASQVAGYLGLIDLGMSSASSRILIDHKDDRSDPAYGSMIQTSLIVGLVQGGLLIAGGLVLFWTVRPGFLPGPMANEFAWLMLGQSLLLALGLAMRVFGNVLWAHQRQDVSNYAEMLGFASNFAVLWVAFARGGGVYSMIWAQLAGTIMSRAVVVIACVRMKLLPVAGCWGRATMARFHELFALGQDVFLFALGSQMVNASQTLMVAPLLGLEAAGVWAVCTRTFTLVNQIVWKVLDSSATPLSELLVRNEKERFFQRFRSVTILSAGLATVGALFYAFCNQPFMEVWTGGKIRWSGWNDILLGIWSVLLAVQRCHTGLLGVRKDLGVVKYVLLIEGLVFATLASVAAAEGAGYRGIIASSVISTLGLSFAYGHWRTRRDFGLRWVELGKWWQPSLRILLILTPVLALLGWLASSWSPRVFLCVVTGLGGPVAAVLVVKECLDRELKQRLADRLPAWSRPIIGPFLRCAK